MTEEGHLHFVFKNNSKLIPFADENELALPEDQLMFSPCEPLTIILVRVTPISLAHPHIPSTMRYQEKNTFMVQEPRGIIECTSDRSRFSRRLR